MYDVRVTTFVVTHAHAHAHAHNTHTHAHEGFLHTCRKQFYGSVCLSLGASVRRSGITSYRQSASHKQACATYLSTGVESTIFFLKVRK